MFTPSKTNMHTDSETDNVARWSDSGAGGSFFYIAARTITITIWRWFRRIFYGNYPKLLMLHCLIPWLNLLPRLWCITRIFFCGRNGQRWYIETVGFVEVWLGEKMTFVCIEHQLSYWMLVERSEWSFLFVPHLRQRMQGRVTMA